MLGQENLLAGLAELLSHPSMVSFVSICQEIRDSPIFRVFALIVFVMSTIWVIAKVYSGDLQNAEKGPVAIRKHSAGSVSRQTVVVHRNLIPITMDGVHAKCTFYYVYEGHNKKRQHAKLFSRAMTLSVSPTVLRSLTEMARGNEVPDVETQEVVWPILEIDSETPDRIEVTPDRARDYLVQNRVLERWSGDDSLSLISLHQDVMTELRDARDNFMAKRIEQLRKAKSGNWAAKLRLGAASRRRPGAVGNYYMRFQFSNDPVFVLTKHPDRDVRMTAWLTVLTSIFAIVMEVFPLNLGDEEAVHARRARTEASAVMLPRADKPIEITNPDH